MDDNKWMMEAEDQGHANNLAINGANECVMVMADMICIKY